MRLKSVEWCGRMRPKELCRPEGGSDPSEVVADGGGGTTRLAGSAARQNSRRTCAGLGATRLRGARKRWGRDEGEGDEFCSELAATRVAIAVRRDDGGNGGSRN